MTRIVEAIDTLRGRFTRLRKGRSLEHLQDVVAVNRNTLRAFLAGENVTQTTLESIERWCVSEEAQTHD